MNNLTSLIFIFFLLNYSFSQSKRLDTRDIIGDSIVSHNYYNLITNSWDSLEYENKVFSKELNDSTYVIALRKITTEISKDSIFWYYHDNNGKVKFQTAGIDKNSISGKVTVTKNGLNSISNYCNGLKEGVQINRQNDFLIYSFFQKGIKQGMELTLKNSQLCMVSTYKNDLKNGREIKFCESEKLLIEIIVSYSNGVIDDDTYFTFDCLNSQNYISEIINLKDGKMFGLIPNFNNKQKLISISLFKNSEEIEVFFIR